MKLEKILPVFLLVFSSGCIGKALQDSIAQNPWEFTGVVLVIIGGSVSWYLSHKRRTKVARMLDEIDKIYATLQGSLRMCERALSSFRVKVSEEFKKGGIDEQSFLILDKRIDDYLKDVREKIINEKFGTLPKNLKLELTKMLEDGKITKNEFSTFEKVLKKASDLGEKKKIELRELLKEWAEERRGIPHKSVSNAGMIRRIKVRLIPKSNEKPKVIGRKKK